MALTSFLAIILLIILYTALRISRQNPDKHYEILVKRLGSKQSKQEIRDTKKRYPLRSRQWVIRKVLSDLDKGKI